MGMKNIVIIEDDRDYLEVLTELLKTEGYEVYGAETGFDVIERMVDKKPDLVITDLKLPHISGEQVMQVFKDKDVIEGVPVLVISSMDEDDIKEASEKIGAKAYIQKPVDKNELVELVKKYAN